MTWHEIGRDSLTAARTVQRLQHRSAVSRAYYAAHSVLTQSLLDAGYVPADNRQTPPHQAQAKLIGDYLTRRFGTRGVRELRATVRRLYAARLDADYNRRMTIDIGVSRQAIRDACSVFLMLEVMP